MGNSPRPVDAFNYISLFIHRYLLPEKLHELYPVPLQIFGRTSVTAELDCFYCKQIKGIDHCSHWPYNIVLGVGNDCIRLITPYTEKITHTIKFGSINHISFREEQSILIICVPGHIDIDAHSNDHTSGIMVFYSADASSIYST